MYERYEAIARIASTHGRRGELAAVPVRGLPSLLHAGLSVSCVPPALKGERLLRVRSAAAFGADGGRQLVSFEGIDDIDAASELVGKTVIAKREDLPDDFDALAVEDLVGRAACDERLGELGRIVRIERGPAQDLLAIEGSFGEVLVPMVDEFLIDASSDPVALRLPAGLVDEGRA